MEQLLYNKIIQEVNKPTELYRTNFKALSKNLVHNHPTSWIQGRVQNDTGVDTNIQSDELPMVGGVEYYFRVHSNSVGSIGGYYFDLFTEDGTLLNSMFRNSNTTVTINMTTYPTYHHARLRVYKATGINTSVFPDSLKISVQVNSDDLSYVDRYETVADDSITSAKIKNNAITAKKIVDGGVTTEKLAEGAIALEKADFKFKTRNLIKNDTSFLLQQNQLGTSSNTSITTVNIFLDVDTDYFVRVGNTDPLIAIIYIYHYNSSGTLLAETSRSPRSGTFSIDAATYPTYNHTKIKFTSATANDLEAFLAQNPQIQLEEGIAFTEYRDYYEVIADDSIKAEKIVDKNITQDKVECTIRRGLTNTNENYYNIVLVSDLHWNADTATSRTRFGHLCNILNAENKNKKIDMLILNGDIVSNPLDIATADYLPVVNQFLKDNLDIPFLMVPGNHECYDNQEWYDLLKYEKDYIVNLENLNLIMLESFGDEANGVTGPIGGSWAASDIPNDVYAKIDAYITASSNDCLVVSHFIHDLTNFNLLFGNAKVKGGFFGHVHTLANLTKNSKPLFNTGHWSYDDDVNIGWVYRVLTKDSDGLSTYAVRPAIEGVQTYLKHTTDVINTDEDIRVFSYK